ncbi:MAG: hypothetical protein Q4Q22_00835, partial [Methanosphaera sp.]|nr:hypothetical protein [Methanosphaera sp.]
TSEGDYSVKLVSSNYTTVTNNYLVAKNEVGDSSVYTNTQTNTIENNGPEATLIETEIIITSDVASDIELYELIDIEGYFTANGVKTNFDSIKIYDNDEIIEVITPWDYEGGIYYTYDVESLGAHNLTFVFEGNDTHLESETSLTFNVYDPDAKIDSYIDLIIDSSVFSGEEFPIDAILHADDDDETPISDATVIIKIIINDETIFEDETTTDDEGWISYPLDTTGMEGTATVELTFEGDSTYSESTASDEIEILPPKKDVIMMLACDDEYYIGEYILVDGTVFTIADDEAVSGLDIDIDITYSDDTFNSITVTTDDEGSFTAQLPANVLGEATITAIIPENDFYNPVELVTETVTIIQRPAADTLLVIDVESPIISGDTLEVNGQLVYYDDNQDEYPISNADVNVKVTMGNEVISQTTVTTDDEGMLQYTMNTSNLAGIMVVEMTFEGNDYYLSSEATEEVEILPAKQNVLITVEADDEIDITIITSGTLFVDDDNQTPVADQTVEITIAYSDGTSITVYNTTDENGMFTTVFEASIPGETTITANFAGNDDYNEASAETVIIIFSFEPVETFITVDVESPINSGDEMVIDGIIIPDDEDDEDELYLGELPITIRITLDDEVILETTVETDDDGMISYAFDTTGIAGSATVELIFDGNDDYLASSDSAVVEILPVKQDVFIALDADDSYELDSTIVVSGELSLTDDDQTPVAGQTVVITVTYSDDTSTTVNSITDDDGSFMAEVPASVVGEVTITASVVDSQLYNDATEEITTEITAPEPVETSIDYVAADSIYSGDNLTVDAILHVADDDETPVAGVEVTIRVTVGNDMSEASVISNDDGSVSFTFDTTGLEGTALVEIEFEGNDEYATCSASDEVLIKPARKEVIILIEADDNYPDNEDMILSGIAYAVDDDETPVEGATVNIVVKFSDESTATYSTVTDTDGTFNVTVSMENLVVGIVDITATIDESDEYYESTTDATTEIVHKTFETFLTVNADSQISSGEELVIDGMIFYNDGDDECALADAPINVKVTVDGEVILETTVNSDSEGMISYTFDTTGITGSATVELTFDGNDDYLASSDTTVVEIIKVKKNVTIEAFIDDEYSLGQEIVVKGSLTATDDQSPISKEISINIVYSDDSTKTITTTTGEDGSFTASFNATVLGPVTITVSSDEDDDYLEAQCVLATDINKIATSLNVNILNSTLGNVTIEAIVTDEEDNPLTEGTIVVKDANGNQILSVEMTSETTIISIPADTAGQLKIKVEFLENEMYLPSVTINQSALETPDEYLTIIDVVRNIRESIVTLDDITAFINNTATITATVKDTDGNDIESGVVEFVDGEGNVLGQANVENGIASIEVLYAKEFTTQITANYISDSEYITDSSATATLTSRKAMTIIEFNELSLVAGQTVNITARVYDEAGNNITVGKVVFKINGKTLKDANGKVIYAKVVNGTATIEYLVPEELAGERVELSATYSGNSKTPGANTSTTIYVNTKEASLTLDSPQEAQIGSTVTFTATINDNNIVNNGKVVFKINGKSLKDANGKVIYAKIINNVASIEYVIPESMKAKEYTLTAVLLCDEYDRLEATKNITITN